MILDFKKLLILITLASCHLLYISDIQAFNDAELAALEKLKLEDKRDLSTVMADLEREIAKIEQTSGSASLLKKSFLDYQLRLLKKALGES